MKIRALLSIEVELNGADEGELLDNIATIFEHARADGRITGPTDAELLEMEYEVNAIGEAAHVCLSCGSDNEFEGGMIEVSGLSAEQIGTCSNCGVSRTDTYTLIRQIEEA